MLLFITGERAYNHKCENFNQNLGTSATAPLAVSRRDVLLQATVRPHNIKVLDRGCLIEVRLLVHGWSGNPCANNADCWPLRRETQLQLPLTPHIARLRRLLRHFQMGICCLEGPRGWSHAMRHALRTLRRCAFLFRWF